MSVRPSAGVVSWPGGDKRGGGTNLGLSEHCRKIFLSEFFVQKTLHLRLIKPVLGKFRGKIKILSTHCFLCHKFAALYQVIAIFLPASFFTHDVAGPEVYVQIKRLKGSRFCLMQGLEGPHQQWIKRGLLKLVQTLSCGTALMRIIEFLILAVCCLRSSWSSGCRVYIVCLAPDPELWLCEICVIFAMLPTKNYWHISSVAQLLHAHTNFDSSALFCFRADSIP